MKNDKAHCPYCGREMYDRENGQTHWCVGTDCNNEDCEKRFNDSNSPWISVEYRYPNINELVLVKIRRRRTAAAYIAQWKPGGYWFLGNLEAAGREEVTHWMRIPPLPDGDQISVFRNDKEE